MKLFVKQLMLAALSATSLTACVSMHGTATTRLRVSGACIAFSPITFSGSGDTPRTVEQVRRHNAAWQAVCAADR